MARAAEYLVEPSNAPSIPVRATPIPEPMSSPAETSLPSVVATPSPEPTHEPHSRRGIRSGEGAGLGPTSLPAGEILPGAEIKGRMTLQEVSDQCAVPLEWFHNELGLPTDLSSGTALRQVHETVSDFEISALRELVTTYEADH